MSTTGYLKENVDESQTDLSNTSSQHICDFKTEGPHKYCTSSTYQLKDSIG